MGWVFGLCLHPYGMHPQPKGLSHGGKTVHRTVSTAGAYLPPGGRWPEGQERPPWGAPVCALARNNKKSALPRVIARSEATWQSPGERYPVDPEWKNTAICRVGDGTRLHFCPLGQNYCVARSSPRKQRSSALHLIVRVPSFAQNIKRKDTRRYPFFLWGG